MRAHSAQCTSVTVFYSELYRVVMQQTVVTGAAPGQPVFVSQPYQTASVVNTYGHRQSTVIGILLLVASCLSIIFNIVDLAIGTKDEYTSYYWYDYEHTLSHESNGVIGHGFLCSVLVSVASLLFSN